MASREHIGNSGALLECCCPKHSFPHLLRWRTSWWVLACPWCFHDFKSHDHWPILQRFACDLLLIKSASILFAGLGLGIIYLPRLDCITQYFDKKRPFVTGQCYILIILLSKYLFITVLAKSSAQPPRARDLWFWHWNIYLCTTNWSVRQIFLNLIGAINQINGFFVVCLYLRNLLWFYFILFSSWRLLPKAEGDWQSVLHLLGDLNIFCRCW